MQKNGVKCLLMGGQACVLYGGAEFSRDVDFAVLADAENLDCFRLALDELQAKCIAVPPFERKYLEMGMAVHFRCRHPDADKLRIDVMSCMRGLDSFPVLWDRRTTLMTDDENIEILSLPDLVLAKKTQRDKDWPMITRLVEANYLQNRDQANAEQITFWLQEMRTPQTLIEVVQDHPEAAQRAMKERSLIQIALEADEDALRDALKKDEELERAADREYWQPLKMELERLRHSARGGRQSKKEQDRT